MATVSSAECVQGSGSKESRSGGWSGYKNRGGWGGRGGRGGRGGGRDTSDGAGDYQKTNGYSARGNGRFVENRRVRGGGKAHTPKLDMTPVGNIANYNVYWEDSLIRFAEIDKKNAEMDKKNAEMEKAQVVQEEGGGGARGGRSGRGDGRDGAEGYQKTNGYNGKGSGRFMGNRGERKGRTPKLDMTPVGNIATYNVYWEDSLIRFAEIDKKNAEMEEVLQKKKEKETNFVWEEPETDFHLEASGLLKELMKERDQNGLKDLNGNTIGLCGHTHGDVCRFCDGRKGSWVRKGMRPSPAFRRYQDSFVGSIQGASASVSPLGSAPKIEGDSSDLANDFEKVSIGKKAVMNKKKK